MRRTEVVVRPGGHITASGDLTSQGADLLRGTADDEALAALRELHRDFRVDGGELLIRR